MSAADPVLGEPSLRVIKVAVPVVVTLAGGAVVEGELHVFPGVGDGRERVIDLLNAGDPFLPLTGKAGAALIGKTQVVMVTVKDRFDARLGVAGGAAPPEVDVEVSLAGVPERRALVRGVVRIDMPPDQARLLDCMNSVRAFFPMLTSDGAAIVNRAFVATVQVVRAPARRAVEIARTEGAGGRRRAPARRRSRR